jgi:hypothetical protein
MKKLMFIIACIACSIFSVTANAAGTCQNLLIPSYFYPGTSSPWATMERTHSSNEIVIINPNSGPGSRIDSNYVAEITRAHNSGLTVLGYVYTGYGVRSATAVDDDVAKYVSWYDVDGVFYDEVSAQARDLTYYQNRLNYAYSAIPQAITVLNPGVVPDRGYADLTVGAGGQLTLVTFENKYNVYLNLSNATTSWVTNYPANRFAHMVYGADTSTKMLNAVNKSKSLNAGYIIVSERTKVPWNYLTKYNSALVTATSCL